MLSNKIEIFFVSDRVVGQLSVLFLKEREIVVYNFYFITKLHEINMITKTCKVIKCVIPLLLILLLDLLETAPKA